MPMDLQQALVQRTSSHYQKDNEYSKCNNNGNDDYDSNNDNNNDNDNINNVIIIITIIKEL